MKKINGAKRKALLYNVIVNMWALEVLVKKEVFE